MCEMCLIDLMEKLKEMCFNGLGCVGDLGGQVALPTTGVSC